MSKSIKFKNNIFLDTSGIVHNRENLKSIIDTPMKTVERKYCDAIMNQENYIVQMSNDVIVNTEFNIRDALQLSQIPHFSLPSFE